MYWLRIPNRMNHNHHVITLAIVFLFFGVLIVGVSSIYAQDGIKMLRYGTWGLSVDPDPFKRKYPAVVYLPPGTIVFHSNSSPLEGYIKVLPHYGHWVQIKETVTLKGHPEPVEILRPIEGLIAPPPSDTIILHESILCLGQTNRIITPPGKCRMCGDDPRTTLPLGKGWIYTFAQSTKPDWVDLKLRLDDNTKAEIKDRGLTPKEANFDITKRELLDLEKQGYLTMLNRRHPLFEFEYQTRHPVCIQCGQKKITQKTLKASAGLKMEADAGIAAPIWTKFITGLKAKLGLKLESEVSGEVDKTWSITVETTNASYLYYAATMTDTRTKSTSNIFIEKVFECTPSPKIGPGNRILSVRFEIEYPDAPDLVVYEFTNPKEYLPLPDEIFDYHPRPIFLSANTPAQHAAAIRRIIDKWQVNVNLAHFMLANINYSCTGRGNTRQKCADLIDAID
ncbi:MAG: hypothetical protein ACFFCW_15220 [Candidatus Hodarchaeota archaeon]